MTNNSMSVYLLTVVLFLTIGATASTVFAAEEKQASGQGAATTAQEAKSGSESNDQNFDALEKLLASIEEQKKIVNDLEKRIGKSKGLIKQALEVRLNNTQVSLLEEGQAFADAVLARQEAGAKVEKYRKQAIEVLKSQADIARVAAQQIRNRIAAPEPGLSAAEQAAAYTKVFRMLDSLNQIDSLFVKNLELSKKYKIDVSKQEAILKEDMADRAANGSILLEMAMNDITALRASVSAMPDDAELKAKLTVATNQVSSLAQSLAKVLAIMESLNMDTAN
jgi:hypothetical protein